jgi:hypothetical protein
MSNERFRYRGPATIDGVTFPLVQLHEEAPDGGLRSWEGSTSFAASNPPAGFSPNVGNAGAVTVELPDDRQGQLLVTDTHFDGQTWTLNFQGTGRPPGVEG